MEGLLFITNQDRWIDDGVFDFIVDYVFNFEKKVAVVMTVDKNRPGNKVDVQRFLKLLPQWGYQEVINVENATRLEMIQTLQKLQNLDGIYHVLL